MQAVDQPPQVPSPPPPPSPPVEHQHAHDALEHGSTPGLWVFGYGSLCWHPGFEYEQSVTGYVRGWARRFWQGNTTHRGTEGKPGRVATLIEEKEGVVWGRAFAVTGDAALPYLDTRECRLGGYRTQLTTFHPGCCPDRTLTALVYVALPCNALWLGDAPLPEMARQIVASRGPSGHNVEYILRLAAFMRHQAPDSPDDHLFALEKLVRDTAARQRLCLRALMGDHPYGECLDAESPCVEVDTPTSSEHSSASSSSDESEPEGAVGPAPGPGPAPAPAAAGAAAAAAAPQPGSFQYSSRVPSKKLRCLNI